jgi:recombination protein U
VSLNETYLLPASYVVSFWKERPRESIPFDELKKNGYLVKEGYSPRYDYLPLVDEIFLK